MSLTRNPGQSTLPLPSSSGPVAPGRQALRRLRRLTLVMLVPGALEVWLVLVLQQGLGWMLMGANAVAIALANGASYRLHRKATFRSDPYLRCVYVPTVFTGVAAIAGGVDMLILGELSTGTGDTSAGQVVSAKVTALAGAATVRLALYRVILAVKASDTRRHRTARCDPPGQFRLTVVVPAYNEADRIDVTVKDVQASLAAIDDNGGVEILVVDDGSTDATSDVAASAGAHPVITLPHNSGKGAAVRTGVLAARGRTVVFTDADLAYAPSQILQILEAVEDGWDMAIGNRRHPDTQTLVPPPLSRAIGSKVTNMVVHTVLLGVFRDTQSGLKGCRSDVGQLVFSRTRIDRFAFDIELLHLAERYGLSISEVPVEVVNSERSTVRAGHDFVRMLWDITRIRHWSALGYYEVDGNASGALLGGPEPNTL